MIDEFKVTLQNFVKKQCKLSDVSSQLEQLLKKHPQVASAIESQLKQLAQSNRITQDDFTELDKIIKEYSAAVTGDKTVIASDQLGDATEIAPHAAPAGAPPPAQDDDSTLIADHTQQQLPGDKTLLDDDSTMVSTDTPPTTGVTAATQADGFEMDIEDTGSSKIDTKAAPTIGADGMPIMEHGEDIIQVGSILRNRFELLSKLGEGGMGAVYKAIDKIKEEAQDKNPYVAIKVLNETFKQFRESFIALQRESSKQQRLAHPNIATVFDFDRDYTYGTVFMSMEMLEGEPLDKFIRRVPPGGLSWKEAKPIIDGMCDGLAYAHKHQLVHSDFKPGNCFINKQGVLKVLDFGIARAAKPKSLEGDGEGESTIFDPGSLGALTPAYASTEMLEGETPDPTDDIYALAAVTYQLLGGKHPFNKTPANQARDSKLRPATIKKLNHRQNKGLIRGLAFTRDKRTQTVEQFHDEITPKKPIAQMIIGGISVLLLIIAYMGYGKYEEYQLDQRNRQMIASIVGAGTSQQGNVIQERLQTLTTYDQASQALIQADPDVQKAIVGYFSRNIDQQIDSEKGKYNYPSAYKILKDARAYYPDSGKLASKEQEVNSKKKASLTKQRDLYTRFLVTGPWLPVEGENNDIPEVLAIVEQIEPENSLLNDPRTLGSYIKKARASREEAEFDYVQSLIEQAEQFAPGDSALINERDELALARFEAKSLEEQDKLEATIKNAIGAGGIEQATTVSSELARLRIIAPESELLNTISTNLATQLTKSIGKKPKKETLAGVQSTFQTFAAALSTEQRQQVRNKLDEGWKKVGGMDETLEQQNIPLVVELQIQIKETSEKAEFTHEWSQTLTQLITELEALVGPDNPAVQQERRALAEQHIQQAAKVTSDQRLSQGQIVLAYARTFDSTAPDLLHAEVSLNKALEEQEAKRLEKERIATIIALKQDLISKAEAELVEDAIKFLDLLKVYLLPDDPFLTTEGPNAIGDAYARVSLRAKNQADKLKDYVIQRDSYVAALEDIKKGLEFAPGSKALASAQRQIQYALNVTETRNTFKTSNKLDIASLRAQLNRIQQFDPAGFKKLQTEFTESVASRIATMENYDPKAAKEFLDNAKQLPLNKVLLSRIVIKVPEPSKYAKQIAQAIKESKLTEAGGILKTALTEESDHPEIKRLRSVLESKVKAA
ncbi:MAG: serine/threonine protein kinase, partial [Gammaproteobacteria bacterium]